MMYMAGQDDKALNTIDNTKEYKYSGGFVQMDYTGLFNNRLVASVMYNWVKPPSYDEGYNVNAYSALLRYYLGDWSAVNVALHAEYSHRITGKKDKVNEDFVSVALDFAF
jgi:hypothetical protein